MQYVYYSVNVDEILIIVEFVSNIVNKVNKKV